MRTLNERFWSKADQDGERECWEWNAKRDKDGYGWFSPQHGKKVHAHRVSWMITNGTIPDGLYVLHTCDNPGCVNPKHLKLGTHQDNMDDMVARNRLPSEAGELNHRAKLTWDQVREIRRRYPNFSQQFIAKEYGVSPKTISKIITGIRWKE